MVAWMKLTNRKVISRAVRSVPLQLLIAILWSSISSSSSPIPTAAPSSKQCTICPHPQHSITLPNATIPIFGTCGALDDSISLIPHDSGTCRLIQSVSSLCGCPISKSSCFLCNHKYRGPIQSSRLVPFLLDVPGVNVTCDIVQAYLHSMTAKDDTCTLIKALVGPFCGCPNSDTSGSISSPCSLCEFGGKAAWPNKTISTGLDLPFLQTCGDFENVAKTYWVGDSSTCQAVQSLGNYCGCPNPSSTAPPCTFCSDGSPVTLVNTTLPFLDLNFNLAGFQPTCGLMDAAIQSIPSTDPRCSSVRLLGSYCGCPPLSDHCVYCPKPGDHLTTPNLVIQQFSQISDGLRDITCEVIFSTQFQVPSSSSTCWQTQSKNFLCGCNNGQYDYLGANTLAKKRVLAWMPRVSGMLSVAGCLYILMNIYWYHRSPLDQYHELVACISFFELIGSIAIMFTTLPIPPYDSYGQPTGIYGAHGTVATCKIQGFFFQLGFTGIFYNLALSVYYVLVVNYGYRESEVKQVRILLHLPLIVGFALAFAGIPYYDNTVWACHVPTPPIQSSRYFYGIVLVPLTIAMVSSALAMFFVYESVRRQSLATNRWRLGNGGGAGGKLARKVFWQSFFFVVALYGSWPILFVAEFSANNRRTSQLYWFWLVAFTLGPLQGFFNFFVYVRPKIVRSWIRRRRNGRLHRAIIWKFPLAIRRNHASCANGVSLQEGPICASITGTRSKSSVNATELPG